MIKVINISKRTLAINMNTILAPGQEKVFKENELQLDVLSKLNNLCSLGLLCMYSITEPAVEEPIVEEQVVEEQPQDQITEEPVEEKVVEEKEEATEEVKEEVKPKKTRAKRTKKA